MGQPGQPKIKHKSFTYHTRFSWAGGRAGILRGEGKPEFRVASPPEFKGEAGVWTPEDLFVASIEACTLATFVAFSERQKLSVVSYESSAEGLLEFAEGGYQFTRVVLRPVVVVSSSETVDQVHKMLEEAHHACLVARSVKTEIVLEAEVRVQ
jgi:organic hydroperoxide reductase OsmC/OhrA